MGANAGIRLNGPYQSVPVPELKPNNGMQGIGDAWERSFVDLKTTQTSSDSYPSYQKDENGGRGARRRPEAREIRSAVGPDLVKLAEMTAWDSRRNDAMSLQLCKQEAEVLIGLRNVFADLSPKECNLIYICPVDVLSNDNKESVGDSAYK